MPTTLNPVNTKIINLPMGSGMGLSDMHGCIFFFNMENDYLGG